MAVITVIFTVLVWGFANKVLGEAFTGAELGGSVGIGWLPGNWGYSYSYVGNKNIYCLQMEETPIEGTFTVQTIIEITNDQITKANNIEHKNTEGEKTSFLNLIQEHQSSEDVMNANAKLARIIQLADKNTDKDNRNRKVSGRNEDAIRCISMANVVLYGYMERRSCI